MPRALQRAVALACAAATVAGAYGLDGSGAPGLAYALLLAGAVALVALRALPDPDPIGQRPAAPRLMLALVALLLAGAVALAVYHTRAVLAVPVAVTGVRQIGLWAAAGACCIVAGHLWDRYRHGTQFIAVYDRRDWIVMATLIALAAAARIANLATDPPGLAPDEGWPLARTLELLKTMQRPVFSVDDMSMTGLYHYVNAFFLTYASWLGLDTVQTAKLPNALFGALTVGILYGTVRLFAPRAVAATAALFLVWLGWPWLLSRMYYLYSGDLLWIALTTWLVVLGFTSDRLSLLAAAGFTAAVGAAWFKTAVLAAPWAAVMCADFVLIRPSRERRRLLWLPVLCFFTLAVSVVPLVAQLARGSDPFWRFGVVSTQRDKILSDHGLSSAQAYWQGTLGALTVLQVHEAPLGRHVVRLGHPALDLVTSALATVGAIWCLWHARRQRGARLALLGFALFLWPAISSYPEDASPAVSRRMVGSAFFVAWLAGSGAAVVAERTVGAQRRTPLMLALAGISIALNVYGIRTSYNTRLPNWGEEFGVNRVYILRALRQAAAAGPVFFHPSYESQLVEWGVVDLPNVHLVKTQEELRLDIHNICGRICTVILPWPSAIEQNDTPAWIEQLSDLIPAYAWTFGPPDPTGIPLYRRAEVRASPPPP